MLQRFESGAFENTSRRRDANSVPPGQIIFREGDPANRFYLIERGKVAVELERKDLGPIKLDALGLGRELGWSWILPPYYEHFTARALEATDAIFFYGTRLREQCEQNHDLGYEMMTRMAVVMLHRIQAVSRQLSEGHAWRSWQARPCARTLLCYTGQSRAARA